MYKNLYILKLKIYSLNWHRHCSQSVRELNNDPLSISNGGEEDDTRKMAAQEIGRFQE